MTFVPGDRVHLAGLGTGIIVEARGTRRYAVDINGRIVVAATSDLEPAHARTRSAKKRAPRSAAPGRTREHPAAPGQTQPSLDLHGKTVDEALEAVVVWMNDVLLAGHGEARVIHGRGGGRLKAALHQYLRGLGAIASFRVDPGNPGVTIVTFD